MDDSKGTLANLLKTLRDQNKGNLLLQGLQVKYEKEIAGEDNDKREKQLDDVNENLKNIEKAVAGNKDQLKVLPKEISVKLSDIKVQEEDKTTLESIKEFVGDTKSFFNKLSGSFGKGFGFIKDPMSAVKGGIEKVRELGTKAQDTFYDIAETKAGYTAEEGRFVEEYKKQNRKFASGMTRDEIVSGRLQDKGTDAFRQIKDLEEKIKVTEAEIQKSNKFGFQATPEDQQKLEELKRLKSEIDVRQKPEERLKEVESKQESKEKFKEVEGKQKPEEKLKEVDSIQTKNEEADNVISAQESIADSFKENNELIKDLLTTTKDQLDVVKNIKDSLAPKEATDEQNSIQKKQEKFYNDVTIKLEEIYNKLDNIGTGNLSQSLLDMLGNKTSKAIPSTATPAASAAAGSPLLAGAALGAVALGGAAATVGATGMLATESAAPLRKAVTQNPMLGAMSGDTALAAGILDANEGRTAEQVRAIQEKENKALQDAPWYTRMLGIGRSDYLRNKGVLPSASPVEAVTGEKIPANVAGATSTKPEATKTLPKGDAKDITKDPKYQKLLQEEKDVIIGGKIRRGETDTEKLSVREVITAEKEAKSRYLESRPREPNQLGSLSQQLNENMRDANQSKPSPAPVIMNNSSSNNNTSYVPMKSTPRPEYTGSALDRYQSRISTY